MMNYIDGGQGQRPYTSVPLEERFSNKDQPPSKKYHRIVRTRTTEVEVGVLAVPMNDFFAWACLRGGETSARCFQGLSSKKASIESRQMNFGRVSIIVTMYGHDGGAYQIPIGFRIWSTFPATYLGSDNRLRMRPTRFIL